MQVWIQPAHLSQMIIKSLVKISRGSVSILAYQDVVKLPDGEHLIVLGCLKYPRLQ